MIAGNDVTTRWNFYFCRMKRYRQLLYFVGPYWFLAVVNIVLNMIAVLLSLVSLTLLIPFLQLLFDQVTLVNNLLPWSFSLNAVQNNFSYYLSQMIVEQGKFQALLFIAVLVVILFFLRNLSRYLAMYLIAPLRAGVINDIRNQMYDHILILPLAYFSEQRKGDILSRISNDVTELEWSVMNSLMMLFRDPFSILIFLTALFFISPLLTVITLLLLPVSGLLISYIGKVLNRYSLKGQQKLGILVSAIEESIHGIKIIKAFNAFGKMKQAFHEVNQAYTHLMNKVYRRRELANPLTEFLAIMVLVAVIWFGGRMVLLQAGGMSSDVFLFYLAVFSQIIPPGKNLITAYYYIEKGMASLHRIQEVLDAEEVIVESPVARPVKCLQKEIEYRGVSFSYQEEPVLKGINLHIPKGKRLAVVGPSGSGKSTLVDLLPRFYDVTFGEILLDGVNIKDIKIEDLRSVFGMVTQDTILFNDTVHNNIAFGLDNVSEEAVEQAARLANAHHFIQNMEQGYQTNIGDRGVKLSGGERQRLSLARAILRNPDVLILDEATSSLDPESEMLIQEALDQLLKEKTAIIVSHRLSSLKIADEIIVIKQGEIVERGTYQELKQLGQEFARISALGS